MDYKKKKMTKQQVWDKLHEERKMWQMKCEHDRNRATQETAIRVRTALDPILAQVVRTYGTIQGEDGEICLDVALPDTETKEGFIWQTRIDKTDTGWKIFAREMELSPPEPEETEDVAEEGE